VEVEAGTEGTLGIGPCTGPDVALHALLIAGLLGGLITTWRMRPDRDRGAPHPRRDLNRPIATRLGMTGGRARSAGR
jgi:hypothetical protein